MLKNKDLFTLLIRLFLGYIFFSAGICKLTNGNFGQIIGPPWLEESLAKYGLGLFAQVVAVSQVVCGTLLLSQRFSLLGAVMLVPMNVAILAVTVSMDWQGTPYVNTVFLGLNLVLLGLEYKKFRFLFQPMQEYSITPSTTDPIGQDKYSWLGIGFCALTMVMAFVSISLTNMFALLAFVCFAVTIVRSTLLTNLDSVLILLPFLAMVAVTFGNLHQQMIMAVAAIVAVEALLLSFRVYLASRNQIPSEVTATASIS
ncbi:DoxX family membrane protein [Pontibacter sp. KCTC 32443]|uniref:DoxX family membrane protein n=1 Tax=Pontibacter TaxID=323449 RepID=UPI00164E9B3F|nr:MULTISPECIES: DoxX family membrane protein [Pontibacter]MBC5772737.1 DoxX family membrane protein [Pontibacter sp. KCTC 32443]